MGEGHIILIFQSRTLLILQSSIFGSKEEKHFSDFILMPLGWEMFCDLLVSFSSKTPVTVLCGKEIINSW